MEMSTLISFHLYRYIDLLYYGIQSSKSRKRRVVDIQEPKQEEELKEQVNYYNMLLHEERDISILELMHSFMQDAPQLALQIYILAKRPAATNKSERDYIITGNDSDYVHQRQGNADDE